MKYNTLHRMDFTAQYWDYTILQDPVSGLVTPNYFFSKNLRFTVVSAEKGLVYTYLNEQLNYNAQLREIRDASGNYVFKDPLTGQSLDAYVGVSEPVFDAGGTVLGYRHDLSQAVAE